MLPSPRIIVIDDNSEHLRVLAEGLGVDGIGCLQIHFTGDPAVVKSCPQARVIFADLHLNDSGATSEHASHFAMIGGLLEEKIAPAGPYVLILWTRYPDQADGLKAYLERLERVPKPFAVKALDKQVHLKDDKVADPAALITAIKTVLDAQPQIAALFNWEERVYEAAANTVSALTTLAVHNKAEVERDSSLAKLLRHLAIESVGQGHVDEDRFRAVNGALLPILADRISVLKLLDKDSETWQKAFSLDGGKEDMTSDEAASLNSLLHFSTANDVGRASEPGAVIQFTPAMVNKTFSSQFGYEDTALADTQFYCNGFARDDVRYKWMLVQIQAACDYAQHKPGTIPFALALELPFESARKSKLQALWCSPPFKIAERICQLNAHACFQVHLTAEQLGAVEPSYRIRDQLLRDLTYRLHAHGMRPGTISFRA
jgi:CheY-like chemotaxis protein